MREGGRGREGEGGREGGRVREGEGKIVYGLFKETKR